MPTIIMKRPHSQPKEIHVSSKTLPDMYQELDIRAVYASLGRGLLLIMQTDIEFDEPNFMYDGIGVMGTVYVVRARANGISDLLEDDLQQFIEQITLIGEDA